MHGSCIKKKKLDRRFIRAKIFQKEVIEKYVTFFAEHSSYMSPK